MEHVQLEAPRRRHLLALGAVALLAGATAMAFARVFSDEEALWKLLAAAAASVAVAAALERRSLLLATAVSAGLLILAIGLLVFPETTLWGLPTSRTLRAASSAIGKVGYQARLQTSPTPALDALLLAAVTAVWAASLSSHALAVRAGSPLLAAVPQLALLAFADAVLEDGFRPGYAALVLIGVVAILFFDAIRRVHAWGRMLTSGAGAHRWRSGTGSREARRVGAAAVGIALLFPGILPGLGSESILDLSGGGGAGTRINPLVSVAASLQREEETVLFEVRSRRPSYWRMLALDEFDGTTWTTEDLGLDDAPMFGPLVPLPGNEGVEGGEPLRQRFTALTSVRSPWIPLAPLPVSIDLKEGGFRYDPELQIAANPQGLAAGTVYDARSRVIQPSYEDLARLDAKGDSARYTQLPADVPPEVARIAAEWTAGETTDLAKILAIQNRLRTEFTYDESVKPNTDVRTMVDFLTETRAGFCQQFASTMAVMLRTLGYPARVAVGFTPGTIEDPFEGIYSVSNKNAHSWVEVKFPRYGWLAFEPTPSRHNPIADAYFYEPPPACAIRHGTRGHCPVIETGGGGQAAETNLDLSRRLLDANTELAGKAAPVRAAEPESESLAVPLGLLLRLALLLAAALLVLVPIAKFVLRRVRVHRARAPREIILAHYGAFGAWAADLGYPRGEGETPAEYRARLSTEAGLSDGNLERLTNLTVRAAYAHGPQDEADARAARHAAGASIRDLRRGVGLVRRLAGIYRPAL